jgi:hypothetical protein
MGSNHIDTVYLSQPARVDSTRQRIPQEISVQFYLSRFIAHVVTQIQTLERNVTHSI